MQEEWLDFIYEWIEGQIGREKGVLWNDRVKGYMKGSV